MSPSREVSAFTAFVAKRAARNLSWAFTAGLSFLICLATPHVSQAQTAQFSYAQLAVGSGFASPQGVAVDANGDVFVADTGNQKVKEIMAVNGQVPASPTIVTLGGTATFPDVSEIAVDASGNVYVGCVNDGVFEILAAGGYTTVQQLGGTGSFSQPRAIAVDANSNVYVGTDYISEMTPNCFSSSCITNLGGEFIEADGIAVDTLGNVYASADQLGFTPTNAVIEMTPNCTATSCVSTITTSLSDISGLARDASGDLFVLEYRLPSDSSHGAVAEIVASGGSVSASSPIITLASDYYLPYGVAVDAHGDIYVAMSQNTSEPGYANQLSELETGVVNFGSIPVGQTSVTIPLTFTFSSPGTILAPAVLTMGAAGLDYKDAGSDTCAASTTYTANETCTVNVTFKPLYSGARWGAVVLSNASGVALATAHLEGIGTGPQILFQGGTETTYPLLSNTADANFGVAVDGGGDIFLGATNSGVIEIPAGCSATSCYVAMTGSNLEDPKGVAIDGGGDLYVSNGNPASVVELPHGCAASSCAIVLGGGWQNPEDVAVDGAGNVYVADSYNNAIKEMPPGCLSTSCVTTLGGGFYVTEAVAVDGYGNVFVADDDLMSGNGGEVKEMTPGCLSTNCVITLTAGGPSTSGLAVDAAGDVYFSQEVPDNAGVYQLQAVNGSVADTSATYNLAYPPTSAVGVALDGAGNVYFTNGGVVKLDTVDAPAVLFSTPTNVGSQDDSDDPETEEMQNIGNVSLTFTGIVPPTNFSIDAPTSICSTSSPLVEGNTCFVSVDFAPTAAGPLSGNVVLTDNNLNVTGATQPIPVSGTGVAVLGPPTASLSSSSLNFGGVQIDTTSPALVETVTNTGGGTVNISGVSIVQTGTNAFFLGTGTNQCTNTTSLMNAQSCNVYVTFDPSLSNHTYNATLDIADSASGSPQTASLTGVGDYFNQNVGNSSSQEAVSVFITTGGTLSAINVVTDGTQTSDYTLQSGGTCATGTAYTAGQVCTVDVIFSPQYSGARNGSIYLTDGSGDILGTTFLEGTGNAPQIIFGPVTAQTEVGYITGLAGVAVDGADDLFYVNGSYQVLEAPVSGPGSTVANISSLISGGTPTDVAIDSSGNLFISSDSEAPLIEVPRTGLTTWGTPVSINTGVGNVSAVATDALGNLYIVAPNSAVYQLPFAGSGYGTPVLLPFPASSTFKPEGVAVDPNLDVYAIGQKTSGNTTEVIELPANNSGYGTPVTIAIAQLTYGGGVGIDANGDLYVSGNTSNTNGAIYFVPATGSPVVVGTGLYYNIVLDSASNIFAVQSNFSDQAEIVEIPQATPPSLTFATTAVGSTSSDSPKTVMVTNVGNEALDFYASTSYAKDFPENDNDTNLCNVEFPLNPGKECDVSVNFTPTVSGPLSEDEKLADENLNNGASIQLIPVSGNGGAAVVPVAGLSPSPATFTGQVAGTTSGAMAITLSNTGGAALTGITPTITGTNLGDFAIGTGTNACTTTLAASSSCNIYVTFTPAGTGGFTATLSVADNASPSPQTATLNGTGVVFSSNVGTAQAAQIVTVNITTAGTLSVIQALTQGAANLDFTATSGGTCATSTAYTVGETCTVDVIFKPQYSGIRNGAIVLTNLSGVVLGTAYLPGIATGPQVVFSPGVLSTIPAPPAGTPYYTQTNIAIDGNKDIYEAYGGWNQVYRVPWTGSSYGTPVAVPVTGLNTPLGIAVDAAGDLFIVNQVSNQLFELPWTGSGFGTQVTLTTSLHAPTCMTIDANGNIFVGDNLPEVVEIPWTGSGYGAQVTVPTTGLANVTGVSTDANGNIYIVDSNNQRVIEVARTASGFGAQTTLPFTGLSYPISVVVGPTGNVYVGETSAIEVYELPWTGTAYGPQGTLLINHLNAPYGLALDGPGNLYIGYENGNGGAYYGVNKLDLADPPSLSFATPTSDGSQDTTDGPQTTTAVNVGNAPLTFSGSTPDPSYPTDFPKNTSDTNLCSSASPLAEGTGCDVSVNFKPTTSGPLNEHVVLTDNNLNGSGVTQSIAVQGTGLGAIAPTINWTLATPITYGTALGSGDFAAAVTSSSTNVSADGTFAYTITSVGGATATASTILPGGANTLCVQWTPSSSYTSQYDPASLCVPVQVNAASTSISWTPASPILSPTPLGSGQFNATASAGSTSVTSDGTLTYYVSSVGGTVATSSTVLPAGSDTLCVQWTPSSSYTVDYSSSQTCTNIQVNASTTITYTPASPITYGATLGAGQLNATAASGTTNIGADGTFTYYVTSVGGTVANGSTVLPGGADTLCVQWTPSSSFTSQYSSASQCSPIQVNAAPSSISWSPSSATIIASSGPTAGQLDAAAINNSETNITADGTVTYHLSTVGGSVVTIGTSLETGPATICAVWAPSSSFTLDYIGSNACQNFTVINTQPTTTTVVTNASPVFLTTSVTFTATVTPTSGSLVPTGSVTFLDNGVSIGTGTLTASGPGASAIAKLTTSSLAAGTHPITVSYAGDTNNQSSTTSAALPEVIEDFSVSASSPTSATVVPGTSATFTIVVSPLAPATTFPAAITLAATGLPTGATATFAPSSIASGAGSTTITLTITTPITTLARDQAPAQSARWPLVALSLLLLPLACKFRRAGRRFSRMLSLLLLFAAGLTAAAALSGCGGTPSGYFGQAQTTSTVTVTGTSGSLSHSATVTLTVE